LFAAITENSIRIAKEESKEMVPYKITLQEANARLLQKNARLDALLQILPGLLQPLNATYISTPILPGLLQPLNATYIPIQNAASSNEIQGLQGENTRLRQENTDLAAKVRTLVNKILL
jgi:hypothetical protein